MGRVDRGCGEPQHRRMPITPDTRFADGRAAAVSSNSDSRRYAGPARRSQARARAAAWALAGVLAGCGGAPRLSGPAVPNAASPREAVSVLTDGQRYPAAMAVCATPEAVVAHAGGRTRAGGSEDVGASTRFALGSLTKSYTATLAALLVQEGRIGWDSRLLDVLPELKAASRSEYTAVTLRQLLAHRSGLPEFRDDAALEAIDGPLRMQRLQAVAWGLSQAPVHPPGTAEAYSNLGYVVAAAMLERAGDDGSARDYEASLARRLLAPLGSSADFGVPGESPGSVHGHRHDGHGWQGVDAGEVRDVFPAALDPTGLLMATAEDQGRFLRMHVRAGAGLGDTPLTSDSARVLHAPQGGRAALGWLWPDTRVDPTLLVHNGTDGRTYMAFMAMSPRLGRACAVAVNGWRDTTPADLRQALLALLGLAAGAP